MKHLFAWKYLYITVAILLASGISIGTYKYIKKLKSENNRLSHNFEILHQEKDSVIDKNGELHFVVNTLELTKSELKNSNSDLIAELKNMRIKLRNTSGITKTNIEYRYVNDTIETVRFVTQENDTIFNSIYKDNYIETSWKSKLSNKNLTVTDFQCAFKDSLLYVTEIEYKGFWFWRKPKNIKLHVKSRNPYSKINEIQNIQIKK